MDVMHVNQFPRFKKIKRIYSPDDPFYELGNLDRELWAKQLALDLENEVDSRALKCNSCPKFVCNIEGCVSSFNDVASFEIHYSTVHKNVCNTCKRIFPSGRLLELHVLEAHDSMFKVLSQKQKMYQCLVEGCKRKFWNDHLRKLHLVDYHKYPKLFNFHPHHKRNLVKGNNHNQKIDKKHKNSNRSGARKENLINNSPQVNGDEMGLDVVLMDMENICVSKNLDEHEQENMDTSNNNNNNNSNEEGKVVSRFKYSYAVNNIPKQFSFGVRGHKGRPHYHRK
jgi:hypothetical protein